MKKHFTILFSLTYFYVYSQDFQLITPKYPTADAFVADISFMKKGIGGDGVTDVTTLIQQHIDSLASKGGGTLYIPEGTYVLKGTLLLKKGVILRGDWQKPDANTPLKGTILMAYAGRGSTNGAPFIMMEPVTGVMDMAIWYPEQYPEVVVPYPNTIEMGNPAVWGNEYCNVRNVTLVNPYQGIVIGNHPENACYIIQNVYGSPLKTGISVEQISDVGRVDGVHFSPAFWENSGLPDAPKSNPSARNYIYSNATGIIIRRNDWSYNSNVKIDGYKTGLHMAPSITSQGAQPNGHNYNLNIQNCNTGIYLEKSENVGLMFANCNIRDCNSALSIGKINSGQIQFHTSTFKGNQYAVLTYEASDVRLMMQKCTISRGEIWWPAGTLMASHCMFDDGVSPLTIGPKAKYIMTGNTFKDQKIFIDKTNLKKVFDPVKTDLPDLPVFADTMPRKQKPARMMMLDATKAPFLAANNGKTNAAEAIQNALNSVASNGGGIVFLPPGKYRLEREITIPSNVELKGAMDIAASPYGQQGAILQAYTGKGDGSGKPLLKLEKNSGLRAVCIDYPEQKTKLVPNFIPYPFAIQVAGDNVYIVNVSLHGAYNGIDLFTHKCDNHFIDYLTGQVLRQGIVVGNNSDGGKISNFQMNPITYVHGGSEKYGFWENGKEGTFSDEIIDYLLKNADFLTLGACTRQTLYNCFVFGARRGVILDGASGISMGTGVDGSAKALYVNKTGSKGFDLINSQLVSIYNLPDNNYIETTKNFNSTLRLFNTDCWGLPQYSVIAAGGNLELHNAVFYENGSILFGKMDGGKVLLRNSYSTLRNIHNQIQTPFAKSGDEPNILVYSSILDPAGINTNTSAQWRSNLSYKTNREERNSYNKSNWSIQASHNTNIAQNAIDGNLQTRWDAGKPQSGDEWIRLDLGATLDVSEITLDQSLSGPDYPRDFEVLTSTDNQNWTKVFDGKGSGVAEIVQFESRKARYIRINQKGRDPVFFWSIHEIYVTNIDKSNLRINEIALDTGFVALTTAQNKSLSVKSRWPESLVDQPILWSSDNPKAAIVNNSGQVSALSEGFALISAKSSDQKVLATAAISVFSKLTSLSISPVSIIMRQGEESTFSITTNPSIVTNIRLIWSSENSNIAQVSQNGKVIALSEGKTKIIVSSTDGSVKAEAQIEVRPGFTVYAYSPPSWSTPLNVFWWQAIPALPDRPWPGVKMDTVVNENTRWYKYNFDQTVFSNVIFNDGSNQTADLTRTKNGWYLHNQWYDQSPWFATAIQTDAEEIKIEAVNQVQKLNARILPDHALYRNITWKVEDPSVVTVDANGNIRGLKTGTTRLVLTSGDQRISKSLTVQVGTVTSVLERDIHDDFDIHPNPADQHVILQYKGPSSKLIQVFMINSVGQVLSKMENLVINSDHTLQFDIADYPHGVYYFKINDDNGFGIKKFIKIK